MARMPGAEWRPLPNNSSRMARYDGVCVHTMVGSLAGTDSYFRGHSPGGTNSHFGTGSDGTIWQWVDTAYRSAANLNGNHRLITIENADYGVGFGKWNTSDGGAVPAFTDAQIEANARIIAWAHKEHGTPIDLMPNSRPESRGTCYHRMGIDPYRVSGGERWSNATGKVCPGNRRIAQIPQIIARAKQIVGGAAAKPTPPPVPEDDMFSDADRAALARIEKITAIIDDPVVFQGVTVFEALRRILTSVRGLEAANAGQVAAISKLADALGSQQGLDAEELKSAVREAIAESVVQVDVNVQGGTESQPPAA